MLEFNDETCEKLFGSEDAENEGEERFKEYFYYNRTYENMNSDIAIRILVGHKGVGKSAILKRCYMADRDNNEVSIWLQPRTLAKPTRSDDFVEHIERWKKLLLDVIGEEILQKLTNNATNIVSDLWDKPRAQSVSHWLKLIVGKIQGNMERFIGGTTEVLVQEFLKHQTVKVYIDDIDRGWSASNDDIRNISALLNAIRDLSGDDRRLKFRLALRSDVYFLVRTSDESTDKIENNVVWLSWENHDILCIMAKRIVTFSGISIKQDKLHKMKQADISTQILSKIITPTFSGKGHWSARPIHNVLLSLTRKRPRDLVKLMYGAARRAYNNNHSQISSQDLETCFEAYSNERLQDIINEYKSELSEISALVLGMRPTRLQRAASENFHFTTDALVKKIKNLKSNIPLHFKNGRPATPKSIIQFLYKIGFISARLDSPEGIKRKDFDQSRFLANEITEFGYSWEIHPAYRWALQPHNTDQLFDSIDDRWL